MEKAQPVIVRCCPNAILLLIIWNFKVETKIKPVLNYKQKRRGSSKYYEIVECSCRDLMVRGLIL